MMNVSAAGGAERQQGEQPEERPLGPGVRPARIGIGRAGRALGADQRGQGHHHDHRQGREKHVLQHGVAQEGNAVLQLLVVFRIVGLRDRPAARERAAH